MDFYLFKFTLENVSKEKIIPILNKWKNKLLRQYIILTYKLYSVDIYTELYLSYKNLYRERIKPRKFVYHVSSPENRESILKRGLTPKSHSESEKWHKFTDLEYPAAIFAANNTCIWSASGATDIWQIDTTKIKNKWFIDLNMGDKGRIMTFEPIPKEAIKLIDKKEVI